MSNAVALDLKWIVIDGYSVCRPFVDLLFRLGDLDDTAVRVTCRFDTGADFSEIPARLVPASVLSSLRRKRLRRRSPTGAGSGDLIDCRFSFDRLRQYEFASQCIINPDLRDMGLLALRDVMLDFRVQQIGPGTRLPLIPGYIQLQLRPDHGGRRV